MRKHIAAAALAAMLMTACIPMSAQADWQTTSYGKVYVNSQGNYETGLELIDGSYYYFNEYGIMQTGVQEISGNLYFFNGESGKLQTGFIYSDGKIYCGHTKYGYLYRSKFFTKKSGARKYYAQEDGTLAQGLTTIDGSIYYFNKANGRMLKNKMKTVDGETYYLTSDGTAAVSEWVQYKDEYYYFDSEGKMAKSQFVGDYYVNSEGVRTDLDELLESTSAEAGDNTGAKIALYGQQFVGNPYVWGGTSLTSGADCSGFVYTIFKNFGYSLLRVANDQMNGPSKTQIAAGYTAGTEVSAEELLPGDLVFYGSSGYASHVAIYIGDGKVVHAVNSKTGIKVTSMTYVKNPIKFMRYWS